MALREKKNAIFEREVGGSGKEGKSSRYKDFLSRYSPQSVWTTTRNGWELARWRAGAISGENVRVVPAIEKPG